MLSVCSSDYGAPNCSFLGKRVKRSITALYKAQELKLERRVKMQRDVQVRLVEITTS